MYVGVEGDRYVTIYPESLVSSMLGKGCFTQSRERRTPTPFCFHVA